MESTDDLKTEIREEVHEILGGYTKSLDDAIDSANAEAMESIKALVERYGRDVVREAAEGVDEVDSPQTPVLRSVWDLF